MKKTIIWIDLVTAPDVPFFNTIINEIKKQDTFELIITGRKFLHVPELSKKYNLHSILFIDCFYGKKFWDKCLALVIRSLQLFLFGLKNRCDIAFSFASRSQTIAAWLLRRKIVNMFDYEGGELRMINALSHHILIPPQFKQLTQFSKPNLESKIIYYPELKESLYAHDFEVNPGELEQANISLEKVIITIRMNSTFAHYQGIKTKSIDLELIEYISSKKDVQVIVFPRYQKQFEHIQQLASKNENIILLEKTINGQNLIWHSDGVISGGGSMIREAVCLGTPAYDIFHGHIGVVESMLINSKQVTKLRSQNDFSSIKLTKSKKHQKQFDDNVLLSFIVESLKKLS